MLSLGRRQRGHNGADCPRPESINEVKPAGVRAEQLAVQHQGQPGQRMPVGGPIVVNAHPIPVQVSPAWTAGLSVT